MRGRVRARVRVRVRVRVRGRVRMRGRVGVRGRVRRACSSAPQSETVARGDMRCATPPRRSRSASTKEERISLRVSPGVEG